MLDKLTIDDFRSRIGDAFRVVVDDQQYFEAQLSEVNELGTGVPGGRNPFSLIWRAAAEVVVPQRIYRIEHDQLGALDIFLVPLGPEGGAMRYEAVFT